MMPPPRTHGFRSILCAVDFSKQSAKALRPADVGSEAAKSLAESSDQDVRRNVDLGRDSSPRGTESAHGVRLVDEKPGVVSGAERGEVP